MEAREEHGKQIADTGKIKRDKDMRWIVPSQPSNARYFVDLGER